MCKWAVLIGGVLAGALPAGLGHAQSAWLIEEQGFWSQTALTGFSFDGLNAGAVRDAARQSFELSGGDAVDLSRWYGPRFPNFTVSFESALNENVSLIWGGSLGEAGEKYRLGPSATLGLALRQQVGRRGTLQLKLVMQHGGALRERSCIGDFGAIGGLQEVNCRLAASTLAPAETLQYLWNDPNQTVAWVELSYVIRF